MRKYILTALAFLSAVTTSARERQLFDDSWLFVLSDSAQMAQVEYNDQHWRPLRLPHDWAIEGDFRADNPSGNTGGALPGGVGWYRKHFTCNPQPGSKVFIGFDGVYMNSTVYVNGHKLGTRPYGYISFEYEISQYLKQGDNVIAVRVDNSDQPNSRWYSGCGIYRHTWLTTTDALHIAHWGNYVAGDAKGNVNIRVDYVDEAQQGVKPMVRNIILDAKGKEVARKSSGSILQQLKVRHPHLWSMSDPYLYTVKSQLLINNKVVDETETKMGFRTVRFDTKTGFWLNDKNIKLNGVCLHHDLGCLGAAFNEDVMHRELKIMKEMGVNAIRCSHNPPAPELLNMCDTMGMVVMDESFDMWRRRKTKNDYARFFDEWHKRDLTDMVKRDRNHPSIVMWSIGNEVLEQWSSAEADTLTAEQANLILNAGHATTSVDDKEEHPNQLMARHLADIVRENLSFDKLNTFSPSGRIGGAYVTAGCNETSPSNHLFKSGALDIIGFNYHQQNVKDVPKNFPGKPFMLSESVSALQSRGFYQMPSDSIRKAPVEWWLPYTDPSFNCSAYDNMHASWSSTHEETWDVVKNTPYCAGQFIWTGFDYIGEPTPYGFPARSSYFGIVDLAGFPKDVYYMYQSEWTAKPVLHLYPHWNWMEGEEVDLWCYYNLADEVELFVNGESAGKKQKAVAMPVEGKGALCTPYHAGWRVKYVPGEVKVIARKNGKEIGSQLLKTAGAPDHLRLEVNYDGRKNVHTSQDGSLVYIEVQVVDKNGILCPRADNQIFFEVEGGTIAGVDNGCPYSMERFLDNHRKAFNGKCLLVVRTKKNQPLSIKAKTYDLKNANINL